MASPKQVVQRYRYTFKGFITGSLSRCRGIVSDPYISMREKCHIATIIHELELINRDIDMESKKQIGAAK